MLYKYVLRIFAFIIIIGTVCISSTAPVASAAHSTYFSLMLDPWDGHIRIDFPLTSYTFCPFHSMLFQSFPFLSQLLGDIQFSLFPSHPVATPCTVSTPDVVNTLQSDAEQALNAANLAVGSITYEYSDIVREGKVISQSPAQGKSVPLNSDVALVISLGPHPSIALELIADSLVAPAGIVSPDDGTGRLFIVDRVGVIKILMPNGEMLLEPFLDLSDKMVELRPQYDERGLLGFVFHPDFKNNNRFFVYYSAPLSDAVMEHSEWDHTSYIAEFMVSAEDANKADAASEKILLQVDQPERNHNGGTIVFGPDDGYLYIALGDGGGANDNRPTHPEIGNGQDRSTLLGSILRIDVDGETHPYAYGIPDDNPFVGMDDRDEIFAYGLRNPFFFSFDREGSHDLFVGDVGQNRWEEINIITSGNNYGWRIKEGIHCFDPDNPDVALDTCPETGAHGEILIDPIITYKNANMPGGNGRAVIGGYVYRGNLLAKFYGKYIFGDWSTSFSVTDGALFIASPLSSEEQMWSMEELLIASAMDARLGESVLAFGQDSEGELYVLTTQSIGPSGETGKIYRIVPPDGSVPFINALDQALDIANQVTIATVAYNAPGWIMIHKNEALGPIIGHAPIVSGINLEVLVTLEEDVAHEQTLYAMLHKDEGIIGEYEFPGPDGPIVDLAGRIMVRPFRVNAPASHMVTMVPDLVGMIQLDAEVKIQEHNLIIGSITQAHSDMVPMGNVISQDPAEGTSVPEGSSINLVISEGPLVTVTFSSDVQPIFTANCTTGCHSARGIAGFLPLISGTSYNNLVNKPATRSSGMRVIPFNASESVLYRRIIADGLGQMPPGAFALSKENQSAIRIWIDEGALNN
ncbi:MAG: PQQ-dependent sugar dehydrogenase [bacterium]